MARVAVVGGIRTPFVKAGGVFQRHTFIDLGEHVVKAIVRRFNLKPDDIEEFIFGTVLVDTRVPNFAREIIFRSGLPSSITAHAISNNCISGLVALTMLAEGISSGRLKAGLAGGAESMSRPALSFPKQGESWFLRLNRARSLGQKLSLLGQFRPGFVIPQAPSPKEPSTGLTMGQHCEITAKEFGITRAAQDMYALGSHQKAVRAQSQGYLSAEIEPLSEVTADNLIRGDTSLEKLGKLPNAFDRSPAGTLSAGNSSALTDGASVIALMSEQYAKQQGREILGYISATEYAAIDPAAGLLMAPAIALPRLLERNKLTIEQIDRFEVHEAFAAQVLSNLMSWEKGWSKVPGAKAIGRIPEEKINVNGGSLAIGHPFAATGGRLILSALHELKRSNQKRAVLSVCAAGAMACAMLLERE